MSSIGLTASLTLTAFQLTCEIVGTIHGITYGSKSIADAVKSFLMYILLKVRYFKTKSLITFILSNIEHLAQ